MASSSDFDWVTVADRGGVVELFHFGTRTFDVCAAKRIIRDTPRPVVEYGVRDLSGLRAVVNVDLDRVYTDKRIDITFPVILATITTVHKRSKRETTFCAVPIDGWHRIVRATELRVAALPCVLLTLEETDKVLL